MKKFYTYVERHGNRIFHRYIDESGSARSEVVTDFPFELFIEGSHQDALGLHGERLSRVQFSGIDDAREFIKTHQDACPIHGQASFAHQFIAKMYPGELEFDFSKLSIVNFDLEVDHDEGFPDPADAQYQILTIAAKTYGGECITFGLKPYDGPHRYVHCESEAQLLREFLHWWKMAAPHFITGWNIDEFDIPYLVNRIENVLGEGESAALSPFAKQARNVIQPYELNRRGDKSFRILGITSLDGIELYKKFAPKKLESYSLDSVATAELDETKVDYSEYGNSLMRLYRENYPLFVEYNVRDVELVERIDRKLQFIRLAVTIALMTKSRYQEAFGTVKIWDNMLYNMLLERGIQIPPHPDYHRPDSEIAGGFVMEPNPGVYDWVVSLDLTSLYPSIVRMYNMSPETLAREALGGIEIVNKRLRGEIDFDAEARAGLAVASNGSCYRQESQGIIPAAMEYVFNERKRFKNLMLDAKRSKEAATDPNEKARYDDMVAMYDATQRAMKVVANGGYGAIANPAFRYFNNNIAEGITLTGQYTIQYIIQETNAFLNQRLGTTDESYVIAADTDSMYITLAGFVETITAGREVAKTKIVDVLDAFIRREIEPMLEDRFTKLARSSGAKTNLMFMKREAIASKAIFRGKKNYVMYVYDEEGVRYAEPKVKVVGLEAVRSSTPILIRRKLTECYKVMLTGSNSELLSLIDSFRKFYYNQPVEAIAAPRGVSELSKWIDSRGQPKKGCPIHVRAAATYNQQVLQTGTEKIHPLIRDGMKMRFLPLRQPNHARSHVIGFIDKLPEEFDLHQYVDREALFKGTFLDPVKSVAVLLGWHVEKVASLESLFE